MNQALPLAISPTLVRLRVADYLLLDSQGAFDGYGKTELIEGEIFYINAQHRRHALIKTEIYDLLRDGLRTAESSLRPLIEVSVGLSEHDVPEPDIVVISEPDGEGLVPGHSVALIVEVADATLQSDLTRKQAIYARAGIPEYWVVDVTGRVIHQMWAPAGEGYAGHRETVFGESMTAATIDRLQIDTAEL